MNVTDIKPSKEEIRKLLLKYFREKKSSAETHRILVEVYADSAPAESTCREWFRKFRHGDVDTNDKHRSGKPKKINDDELRALICENPSFTQGELAELLNVTRSAISMRLKAMGMVRKEGSWIKNQQAQTEASKFVYLSNSDAGVLLLAFLLALICSNLFYFYKMVQECIVNLSLLTKKS